MDNEPTLQGMARLEEQRTATRRAIDSPPCAEDHEQFFNSQTLASDLPEAIRQEPTVESIEAVSAKIYNREAMQGQYLQSVHGMLTSLNDLRRTIKAGIDIDSDDDATADFGAYVLRACDTIEATLANLAARKPIIGINGLANSWAHLAAALAHDDPTIRRTAFRCCFGVVVD